MNDNLKVSNNFDGMKSKLWIFNNKLIVAICISIKLGVGCGLMCWAEVDYCINSWMNMIK